MPDLNDMNKKAQSTAGQATDAASGAASQVGDAVGNVAGKTNQAVDKATKAIPGDYDDKAVAAARDVAGKGKGFLAKLKSKFSK